MLQISVLWGMPAQSITLVAVRRGVGACDSVSIDKVAKCCKYQHSVLVMGRR